MASRKQLVRRLKALRNEQGLSQAALAQKANLAREFLARLELGQHDPSLSTLSKLAKALKVKISEMLE